VEECEINGQYHTCKIESDASGRVRVCVWACVHCKKNYLKCCDFGQVEFEVYNFAVVTHSVSFLLLIYLSGYYSVQTT
jgi:hypothetical protein